MYDPIAEIENDPIYEGHYVSDEFSETVLSLRHLKAFLQDISNDRFMWKWSILAAHSALQNACVCILSETAGTGALTKNSTRALLERLDQDWQSDNSWPKERLAGFPELMTRASKKIGFTYPKKPYWSLFDRSTDIARLHNLRNGFSHFTPKSLQIELDGLPRIVLHAIETVREIATSSAYSRHNRFEDFELEKLFAELVSSLKD